ncbi:glycosyltransferase family 4 protein [Blastococcus haudaquaticus]|uniref:Glycosyltransferase involved in cell wall bisynthesis n=1 Tax=Blastococcus haudaquaticus TaxID=1938745 RepID=A0A286GSK4_9ACTN|nr:glycosyltransferase family 4 protein [Blastococcus haudaquaticus]SOD98523.1 Glycosyltransferase involved in cell wall bisynthesis [Blastococcus haudaquaticus]
MLSRSTSIDVLFVNWRDVSHPEGGGSERYVHRMAEGLAGAGLTVELFCAAHDRAPAEEMLGGVRIVRRGGRLGVYPRALRHVLRTRPRLVVDVQNGLPFASPLVTRRPVVNLVHHVHREQWPIVFGRVGGAIGWWVESVLAPRIYRRSRYVTVSTATAEELAGLGIDRGRLSLVRNGVEPPLPVTSVRSAAPHLVVLGRLVPHKRVEHAIEVVARLRDRWPDLRLSVVGEGWWDAELRARAVALGVDDVVDFTGHVDEQAKHEELARAWVHLCPSVKEGWGLVVTEAGSHRVPTVGYRSAGGLNESVVDGVTGVLVDDLDGMVEAVDDLLANENRRLAMGKAAARHAASFHWPASVRGFAAALASAVRETRPAVRGSAVPVAVVQDVDRLVGRLDAVVGVEGGLDTDDSGDAERGPAAEGDEHGDQGLHSGTRFHGGRRRSVTVEGVAVIHNTDPLTITSQHA